MVGSRVGSTPERNGRRHPAPPGHLRIPDDRGSVAIEAVLVIPVVMVILFLVVQFAKVIGRRDRWEAGQWPV